MALFLTYFGLLTTLQPISCAAMIIKIKTAGDHDKQTIKQLK